MARKSEIALYFALIGANLIYACESIFTRLAADAEPLSMRYMLLIGSAVAVLGVYAIIWQQLIKRLPVSDAYMFKGTALIFVLLISALIFGEHITIRNVIGASMIVGGIIWFSKV